VLKRVLERHDVDVAQQHAVAEPEKAREDAELQGRHRVVAARVLLRLWYRRVDAEGLEAGGAHVLGCRVVERDDERVRDAGALDGGHPDLEHAARAGVVGVRDSN
jgi:hypothetical protein